MADITVKPDARRFKRVLHAFDMTLFTVCAILIIDQLTASAAIGVSSLSWWVVTFLFFFIPYGLITAELGTTYADQGGIYAWVKRAFGDHWAAQTSWLYWVNVALWMPSVYLLFTGVLAELFGLELGLWTQISAAIVLTWLTVLVDIIALDISKWVPNIGAIFKAIIMLAIGLGGFWYAFNHGVANDFSAKSFLPDWGSGLQFLPVIVYNFLGFELMSGAGEEMDDPAHDVLKAILISGALITVFYVMATIGILVALPVEQINLVSGLIDTLRRLYGDSGFGGVFVMFLGFGALYTFFANMTTWTIGANRSASEAANRGDLPRVFGRMHSKFKTPIGASLITGVLATVVVIVYGLMASSAEELFWTLFKFSSIVFLLPYIAMFAAFVRLRQIDPSRERPYRVPGGQGVALLLAAVCSIFIVQAIVLFVWVPGEPLNITEASVISVGVLLTVIVGEILIRLARKAPRPNNTEAMK